MGLVIWSITHAPGADGQSGCLRVWLAAAPAPCYHTALVVNRSLRSVDHTPSVLLSQMGVMFAVYLVDRHQVCSATEWSGFFHIPPDLVVKPQPLEIEKA
jgi:hypothetical protein